MGENGPMGLLHSRCTMASRQCTTAGVKISIKEVNLGMKYLKECSHPLANIMHFVDPQFVRRW